MPNCNCPTVLSVTVNPSSPNMVWGSAMQHQTFSATVIPSSASQDVVWNIVPPGSANVSINQAGQLTLAARTPTVTVTPNSTNVVRGSTLQFNANVTPARAEFTVRATTVCGTAFGDATVTVAEMPQAVTWNITPPVEGVGINSITGMLTVGPNVAHNTPVTVRATRNGGTEFGTATVTIVYAPIESINISPSSGTISQGSPRAFTVTVTPLEANQALAWVIPTLPGATVTITGSTIRVEVAPGENPVIVDLMASPNTLVGSPSTITLRDLTPSTMAFDHPNMPGMAGANQTVTWGIVGATPPGVEVTHDGGTITVMVTGTAAPGTTVIIRSGLTAR